MLLNQPDDNPDEVRGSGNGEDIDIKPSGMMKVFPNPGGGRQIAAKRANRFVSLLKRPGVMITLIALVFAGIFYTLNLTNDITDVPGGNSNDESKADGINGAKKEDMFPYFLSDEEVCGNWSVIDYVANIRDFDANMLNCVNYEIKLYWYYFEFFEDKTAAASIEGEKKIYNWVKDGDILSGLPDIITVSAVEKINGTDYMFIRSKTLDSVTGIEMAGYYALKKNKPRYLSSYSDVRDKDLRNYDLSDAGGFIYTILFNEKTRFPQNKKRLMLFNEYQPEYIMEHGKNPGLGVKSLHERGITGNGVNIAVIDESLLLDHPEYKGKIAGYKDFGSEETSSEQGPAVVSLLAGENNGVAPGVKIYYAAVPSWKMYDAEYYAKALDWILEINETLPEGEKIRAVCISPNPENPIPWINVEKYLASFKRATESGILVIDCTDEHGLVVGACKYSFDNPEDISLCRPLIPYRIFIASNHYDGEVKDIYNTEEDNKNIIRAPVSFRTMAEAYEGGENPYYSYQYDGPGRLSWAVPYVTGVLAMGWQVRPELTPDEMIKILFDTAYVDESNNKYIYPTEFIGYLQEQIE